MNNQKWAVILARNKGELVLLGTFELATRLQGADIVPGLCWDAQSQTLEKVGDIQGRFMASSDPGGVRLIWMINPSGKALFEREPYAGVALPKELSEDDEPIMVKGAYRGGKLDEQGEFTAIVIGSKAWDYVSNDIKAAIVRQ